MFDARKPHVLFVTEASYLSSGYSTYAAEVLKRLHATGRFELMELGCFGSFADPRAAGIPWRYASAMPDPNDPEQVRRYDSNPLNKFGQWRFEDVCLDFRPDVVVSYRDWWYDEYISRSPLRQLFHWAHMPAVDAEPQLDQWVATYLDADAVFGYTDWGLEVLRRQSGGRVRAVAAAPPGADTAVFAPAADRAAFKAAAGLPEDALVVGTVMRNQARKLFPDLIEAFASLVREGPAAIRSRTYLYLHTSYPETCPHWDLPALVREHGVGHRTLFTYLCPSCGAAYPSPFADARAICRKCGRDSAVLPDPTKGVTRDTLAKVYNLFDCYVQYATNEGFGMPAVEAAACGVPVFAVDYSAMGDVVRKVAGTPVPVQRFSREVQTGRKLALPDNAALVAVLGRFLLQPEAMRLRAGHLARKGVLEHYTYERTAAVWADHFDSVKPRPHRQTWDAPAKPVRPNLSIPDGLSDEEWVRWGMCNVAGRPDLADSFTAMRMARDLNWGQTGGGMGGMAFNDATALGVDTDVHLTLYDRDKALKQLLDIADLHNRWDDERVRRSDP
jgi:glycosyltransferase involved in cell wall biosynthesis